VLEQAASEALRLATVRPATAQGLARSLLVEAREVGDWSSASVDVDAVRPHIHVVHCGQIPVAEGLVVGLPLRGQPGHRRRGQARAGAQELLQRRDEVPAGQPVQIQQRQHLADLRRLPAPRRQDRRGEPHARAAAARFAATYGAKFAKATAKVTDDLDQLLAFYDYPAEHWVHLRTTNPIESTFATVRHRTRVTKGPGSRAAGLAMAFKLIEAAQDRWRAVNAPHLVALVRNGATFTNGKLVERPDDNSTTQAAA
jgi:hypothetical protein